MILTKDIMSTTRFYTQYGYVSLFNLFGSHIVDFIINEFDSIFRTARAHAAGLIYYHRRVIG